MDELYEKVREVVENSDINIKVKKDFLNSIKAIKQKNDPEYYQVISEFLSVIEQKHEVFIHSVIAVVNSIIDTNKYELSDMLNLSENFSDLDKKILDFLVYILIWGSVLNSDAISKMEKQEEQEKDKPKMDSHITGSA